MKKIKYFIESSVIIILFIIMKIFGLKISVYFLVLFLKILVHYLDQKFLIKTYPMPTKY